MAAPPRHVFQSVAMSPSQDQVRAFALAVLSSWANGCAASRCPQPTAIPAPTSRPLVVVDERTVVREEPAPHGKLGGSTAYRISDVAPARSMEFRKRVLHVGTAIGVHLLTHDEVYYVLAGEGEVTSDGATRHLGPGFAAYLYQGSRVGIRQIGERPLTLIVSYPLERRLDHGSK